MKAHLHIWLSLMQKKLWRFRIVFWALDTFKISALIIQFNFHYPLECQTWYKSDMFVGKTHLETNLCSTRRNNKLTYVYQWCFSQPLANIRYLSYFCFEWGQICLRVKTGLSVLSNSSRYIKNCEKWFVYIFCNLLGTLLFSYLIYSRSK